MTWQVLLSTMLLQMKQSFVRPMFRFCLLANPVLNTILVCEMFRNSGRTDFAAYAVLGAGLMGLWGCICFSSAGDLNRERYMGTLSLLFAVPAPVETVLWGKILGNTLLSLGTLLLAWLTAGVLYGTWAIPARPGWLLLALVVTILCFLQVSVLTAWLLTLSRKTTLYMNCLELPVVFLCGFVVPVEELPAWLQAISNLLPPTWVVRLLRMAVAGVPDENAFWRYLGILAVLMLAAGLLSRRCGRAVDRRVRVLGNLEVC